MNNGLSVITRRSLLVYLFYFSLTCCLTASRDPSETACRVHRQRRGATRGETDCLGVHNYFRDLHKVPHLKWDDELAARALTHSQNMARKNLIAVDPFAMNTMLVEAYPNKTKCCDNLIVKWYNEGQQHYDYSRPSHVAGAENLLEIIWRSNTHLGCGSADSVQGPLLTCIYAPGANFKDSTATNFSHEAPQPETIFGASTTQSPELPSASSSNATFDKDKTWSTIQSVCENYGTNEGALPGDRKQFLKTLVEKINLDKPQNSSVLIINLENKYRNNLKDVLLHRTFSKYGTRFGVWIFKCGTFMNFGSSSEEDSAHAGENNIYASGLGQIFRHPECSSRAYRPFNHLVLEHKNLRRDNLRQFENVDSIEECATWVMEINANAAVYERQTKKCSAKKTDKLEGISFDGKGIKLGQYDVGENDLEATQSDKARLEWIKKGTCDLIYGSVEGQHRCKSFPRDDKVDLLLINCF